MFWRHGLCWLFLGSAIDLAKRIDSVCRISDEYQNLFVWFGAGDFLWPAFGRVPGVENVAASSSASLNRRSAMIKHLIKLIWNRKRVNFLITVEIFVSFLVLFAVMMFVVYYEDNYRQPLGFTYDNVWNVSIDVKQDSDDYFTPAQLETTRQLYLTVKDMPEIEAAASALSVPYEFSGSFGGEVMNGKKIEFERDEVTDGFKEVFNLTIVAGRWFSKDDDGANFQPIVINQCMATEIFGAETAVGKTLGSGEGTGRESRVIG